MNKHNNSSILASSLINRRSFLIGAGAITVGFAFSSFSATSALAQISDVSNVDLEADLFVRLSADGTIRILYHKAEMGQGILTGLPMLIAEEMDADWNDVIIERALGSGPIEGQSTVGSTSTTRNYIPLRLIGAKVRNILLINAAEMLNVPLAELTTEPSRVIHSASGRSLTYGEIAAKGYIPETLPELTEDDLKSPDQFRLIGSDLKRNDIPSKTNGTAVFGIDIVEPDMLFGAILRPPVAGEKPLSIDDAAARKVAGVVAIVTMPNGVGVVAESLYAARMAVDELNVSWSDTALARSFSSDKALEQGLKTLLDQVSTGVKQGEAGDFENAARIERLEFQTNLVAHVCMEPMNAVVRLNNDKSFDVWSSCQNPPTAIKAVRSAAGRDDAEVRLNVTLLGGGFGRRNEADYIRDATLLAMGVPGRAVKMVWTREEDLQFDPYRPFSIQQIEAALDDKNNIIGWRHRIVASAYGSGDQTSMEVTPEFDKFDYLSAGGGSHPYTEFKETEFFHASTGIKTGAWRGISDSYMKYPIETMIDHLADLRGEDPVAYRLSLLPADSAAARTIRAAADMAGWDSYKPQEGRALGFGYSDALRSHTACVAEVSVNKDNGKIHVHKVWAAIDCGTVVMPDQVVAQVEGSIIISLSPTLREYVPFVDGVPQISNLFDYEVMRQEDIPDIEVQIVQSTTPPTGVGEAAISPLVPAVTNAARRALGGVHINYLPMLPEKISEMIKA